MLTYESVGYFPQAPDSFWWKDFGKFWDALCTEIMCRKLHSDMEQSVFRTLTSSGRIPWNDEPIAILAQAFRDAQYLRIGTFSPEEIRTSRWR